MQINDECQQKKNKKHKIFEVVHQYRATSTHQSSLGLYYVFKWDNTNIMELQVEN